MAELEKGKAVSLEELMVTTLAMADAVTKLLIERGIIHVSGVQAEAAGGACGLPAHSESNDTVTNRGIVRCHTQ
jgi:hypothetical protein